jgi:hypothetical protein
MLTKGKDALCYQSMSDNTMSDNTTDPKPQENEWAKRECGALWLKQSPTQKYFSGHVTLQDEMGVESKVNLVIFSNKHKKKDNHPDFRVYRSEPKQAVEQQTEVAVAEEELI